MAFVVLPKLIFFQKFKFELRWKSKLQFHVGQLGLQALSHRRTSLCFFVKKTYLIVLQVFSKQTSNLFFLKKNLKVDKKMEEAIK